MNERQRMIYTEALGIDTFVPRRALRLMPPSQLCVLPLAETGELYDTDSSVPVPASNPTPVSSTVSPVVARIVEQTATEARVDGDIDHKLDSGSASLVQTKDLASEPRASFVLNIWQVANDLLIIDSRQAGDALPTHRLLANVITAFGRDGDHLPVAENLTWPPANARQAADYSWRAAREFVSAFLDARLQQSAAAHLLLFGDAACKSVLGDKAEYTPYQRIDSKQYTSSISIATMPSLAHLLRHPIEKRALWLFLHAYFG